MRMKQTSDKVDGFECGQEAECACVWMKLVELLNPMGLQKEVFDNSMLTDIASDGRVMIFKVAANMDVLPEEGMRDWVIGRMSESLTEFFMRPCFIEIAEGRPRLTRVILNNIFSDMYKR